MMNSTLHTFADKEEMDSTTLPAADVLPSSEGAQGLLETAEIISEVLPVTDVRSDVVSSTDGPSDIAKAAEIPSDLPVVAEIASNITSVNEVLSDTLQPTDVLSDTPQVAEVLHDVLKVDEASGPQQASESLGEPQQLLDHRSAPLPEPPLPEPHTLASDVPPLPENHPSDVPPAAEVAQSIETCEPPAGELSRDVAQASDAMEVASSTDDPPSRPASVVNAPVSRRGGRGGRQSGAAKRALVWDPPGVALSKDAAHCAPQLNVSKDQLTVTGEKGFRMVRATHGVKDGAWYCEVIILQPDDKKNVDGHVRVGWSSQAGELQGPVGYDEYSYGYRDIMGSKIHRSLRHDDYGEPYGPGDVIGMLLRLQDEDTPAAALDPVANSVRYFRNGVDQGIAYQSVPCRGFYYPAVSLYKGGKVRMNFGPQFIYPPPKLETKQRGQKATCSPISDLKPMSKEDIDKQAAWVAEQIEERSKPPPVVVDQMDVEPVVSELPQKE